MVARHRFRRCSRAWSSPRLLEMLQGKRMCDNILDRPDVRGARLGVNVPGLLSAENILQDMVAG